MFCEKCGNKAAEGESFCKACGAPLAKAESGAAPVSNPAPAKKLPKKAIAAAAGAAVLIIAVVAAVMVLGGKGGITGNANELKFTVSNQIWTEGNSLQKYYKQDKLFGQDVWDYSTVDPKEITKLYVANVKNSDLKALRYCENLRYLRIAWTTVGNPGKLDLTPLKELKNLECLSINGGLGEELYYTVDNLKPLGEITSLAALELYHCNVTDISGLETLGGLNFLKIDEDYGSDTKIKDYSPLYNLVGLGQWTYRIEEIRQWDWCPTAIKTATMSDYNNFYGLWVINGNFKEHYETVRQNLPYANIMPPL